MLRPHGILWIGFSGFLQAPPHSMVEPVGVSSAQFSGGYYWLLNTTPVTLPSLA
jgi:hypothetical protein